MKVKILKYIDHTEIGIMVDLNPGEIIAMDDEVCEKLISAGKAEIEF